MPKPKQAYSKENYALLFGGLSVTTLADVFELTPRHVRQALATVEPFGTDGNATFYTLQQAAPYLVKPVVDIAEQMKNLRPTDLPPLLQKDFWAGQKSRQSYLEDSGELWRTEKVQQVISKVLRPIREQAVLFTDTVEEQVGLTPEQRKVVQSMADGMLKEMYRAVIDEFKDYDPSEDHDSLHYEAQEVSKIADQMPQEFAEDEDEETW